MGDIKGDTRSLDHGSYAPLAWRFLILGTGILGI